MSIPCDAYATASDRTARDLAPGQTAASAVQDPRGHAIPVCVGTGGLRPAPAVRAGPAFSHGRHRGRCRRGRRLRWPRGAGVCPCYSRALPCCVLCAACFVLQYDTPARRSNWVHAWAGRFVATSAPALSGGISTAQPRLHLCGCISRGACVCVDVCVYMLFTATTTTLRNCCHLDRAASCDASAGLMPGLGPFDELSLNC